MTLEPLLRSTGPMRSLNPHCIRTRERGASTHHPLHAAPTAVQARFGQECIQELANLAHWRPATAAASSSA